MSTVISEGISHDGTTTRIFEPPQANLDNQRPRYLTFLGSFITPEVVAQRAWTRGGGYEVANPCLRYVRNFLRKGRITPLLKDTHDFLPYDYVKKTTEVDPLSAGYFAQQIPKGYIPPNLPPPNGQGGLGLGNMGGYSPYGMMVGKLALPGEQIGSILNGDDNVCRNLGRKGIVEFTSLLGHEYRPQRILTEQGTVDVDPTLWEIQRAIFPQFPVVPPTLDEIEQLLAEAPLTLQTEVDVYRESLSQFRGYADIYIQNVHQQMRERAPNGYVRPYTAGDLVLLDQLGMERQDRQGRAPIVQGTSDAELKDILAQFMQAQLEEKQELARMRAEQREPQATAPIVAGQDGYPGYPGQSGYSGYSGEVIAEQMAAAMPIPEEVKMWTCEHCGDEMKATAQGIHLGRWCPTLHPKVEAEIPTQE